MFFINGQYTSSITVQGVTKIIAKIGDNRVFYDCNTREIQQIGVDRVTYNHRSGYIEKIGELEVFYDVETGRITNIGKIPVNYDEQGYIVTIGNATVSYAYAPDIYAPVHRGYYTPIKEAGDLPQDPNLIQPIGFSLESANRERMAEFLNDLSNNEKREAALFRIAHNLKEEQNERENGTHFSDGYFATAIEQEAIGKLVPLLKEPNIGHKVMRALSALCNAVQPTYQKQFLTQINAEVVPILDAIMATMPSSSTKLNENAKKELTIALELFASVSTIHLSFQATILDKKVILEIIQTRNAHPFFRETIDNVMSTIAATNENFRHAILRAEKLTQNPPALSVDTLKSYYIAHSLFTGKKALFQNIGTDVKKLDSLIEKLQKQAQINPKGASDQTIAHFALK